MATAAVLMPASLSPAGPLAFTEAVLEAIGAATWPDGSALVDVDPDVLRARLAPQILESACALAASTAATSGGI